jgi:integrase
MGRKRNPGLYKRNGIWHIDKKVSNRRICLSTGTDDLAEAEKCLARKVEEIRQATLFGVRPSRTFAEAAQKFVEAHQHHRSIRHDTLKLIKFVRYIGDLPLNQINMQLLQPYIDSRRKEGKKSATINATLKLVRRITRLAAGEWTDDFGLTWLENAPKITMLPMTDARKPYPLSWEEQARLFARLPEYLHRMALFATNTGCRDQEICRLRWEWEIPLEEFPDIRLFIIPGVWVKNGCDRLIVCNKVAASIIEQQRDTHPTHVFHYRGHPVKRMMSTAWRQAREAEGLERVRVHDTRHTCGRRLRAAGVSLEDRADIFGHRSGRITTHYSAAELGNLVGAVNKICEPSKSSVVLNLLQRSKMTHAVNTQDCGALNASFRKSPADDVGVVAESVVTA